LKGRDKPIIPYKYNSKTIPNIAAVDEQPGRSVMLKLDVTEQLSLQLDAACNGKSSFTLVVGPPGTAKSAAVAYFRRGAIKRIMQCVCIHAQRGHDGVPYGVMKELFLKLVGEDNFSTENQQRTLINQLLNSLFPDGERSEIDSARRSLIVVLGIDWNEAFSPGSKNINNSLSFSFGNDKIDESEMGEDISHYSVVDSTTKSGNQSSSYSGILSLSTTFSGPKKYENAATPPANRSSNESIDNATTDAANDSNSVNSGANSTAKPQSRKKDDLTFFKVLKLLLEDNPTAIVIEYAHFCDELSWDELYHLLVEGGLSLSVLITMENKFSTELFDKSLGHGQSTQSLNTAALSVSTPTPETTKHQQRKKHSLLSGKEDEKITNLHNHSYISLKVASSSSTESISSTKTGTKYGIAPVSFPINDTQHQIPAAYLAIVSHANTRVIEMTSLNEDEVRSMLMKILEVSSVSNDIVQLVLDVSSGSAFWCKAIGNFIKERGVKELEKAMQQGAASENPLKVLILLRLEKLNPDSQLIIKHASILGEEFSEKMLAAVLPKKLATLMPQSLKQLVEDGFITPVEEYPQAIFEFQNNLIKDTLYNLMPPSDAAHIHLKVAEFIEVEYANKLHPLYPILSHHYKRSIGKRPLAFKYKVKAADQAICRGAFNDGLMFVDKAARMAVSKSELRVLIAVISRALDDLSPQLQKTHGKVRRLSFNRSNALTNTIAAYMQLKINAEAALDKVSKSSNISAKISSDAEMPLSPVSNRIIVSRQPSAKLNWQPSYVAARNSMEKSAGEMKPGDPSEKSNCIIS